MNDEEALDGEWFVSPGYEADTVTIPASMFGEYDTGIDSERPPSPLTDAVHGSWEYPVKGTDVGQSMVTCDSACRIWNPIDA